MAVRSLESNHVCKRADRSSVYNLKRRITSLPPVSLDVFQKSILLPSQNMEDSPLSQQGKSTYHRRRILKGTQPNYPTRIESSTEIISQPSLDSDDSSSSHNSEADRSSSPQIFNPQQCLFCPQTSPTLSNSLTHMSNAHSFFIPNASYLIDPVSFLSYLSVLISDFHECLFCGAVKGSKAAVWDHMRGKGHCRLGERGEQEMEEFWDFGDDGDVDGNEELGEEVEEEEMVLIPNEDNELRLPSGKILGHRSHVRTFRQASSAQTRIPSSPGSTPSSRLLTEDTSDASHTVPASWSDRRIAIRENTATSMIGVPELQLRALIAVEQQMEKLETRARNEYQSKLERGGNRQKRFRVLTMGKKAGGLEKRLG